VREEDAATAAEAKGDPEAGSARKSRTRRRRKRRRSALFLRWPRLPLLLFVDSTAFARMT
jgi:hypothetical protein